MERTEIACPRCHQVNVRHRGSLGLVLNTRWPSMCSACGADLQTGQRSGLGTVFGLLMWSAQYVLHGLVGLGAFSVLATVVWPGILDQPLVVRTLPAVVGLAVGVWLAERSRRNKTILSRGTRR
jgi:hypothetical protein